VTAKRRRASKVRRQADRRLSVRAVRRGTPDAKKLSRAFIGLALARAKAEADAEAEQTSRKAQRDRGDDARA
jgi:hypothetical protein